MNLGGSGSQQRNWSNGEAELEGAVPVQARPAQQAAAAPEAEVDAAASSVHLQTFA
jgi:hypothetical protein